MQTQSTLIQLILSASRATCEALLETTDGDIRAVVQSRIKVLDVIQFEAQKTIYRETPPGMVDSWQLRGWWYENFGIVNICDIDFQAISDGKKSEWYAYSNKVVENNL